jgi:mono/diheme cytochrome c family protein
MPPGKVRNRGRMPSALSRRSVTLMNSSGLDELHLIVLVICAMIGVVVFAIMLYSIFQPRRNSDAPTGSKRGNSAVDIAWSILPLIMLVVMTIPATRIVLRHYAAENAEPVQALTLSESMRRGERIYESQCASCHRLDGAGVVGRFPALRGSAIVTGDVARHLSIVANGKSGTAMPAFGARLGDADLAAVMTYQRNAWGNDAGELLQPADIARLRSGN